MSGISGFCSFQNEFGAQFEKYDKIITDMGNSLVHRGNGKLLKYYANNTYMCVRNHMYASKYAHAVRTGDFFVVYNGEPDEKVFQKDNCSIVFDGELYNKKDLQSFLRSESVTLNSDDDCEIVLNCFLCLGYACAEIINGVFAFAVWDETNKSLFVCRDRLGVKPLFFTQTAADFIFASEIKALLKYPGIKAKLDKEGLCELFGLFPSKTEGSGVFAGIRELPPGHIGVYKDSRYKEHKYWDVASQKNRCTKKEAVEHTRFIVEDSIIRQLDSNGSVCTFLSGGVDSSIVSAVAAKELAKTGERLNTLSFDYEENERHFQSHYFQDDTDKKWALLVSDYLKTNHQTIECGIRQLVEELAPAVIARDLPGMADVDSSMLYLCKETAKKHQVVLTGECADEFFGGYSWFHSGDALRSQTFPWIRQLQERTSLIAQDVLKANDIEEYVRLKYESTIASVPLLAGEGAEERRRREMAFLNMRWFMANLRDRTERCSAAAGLSARVPYADYRIVEFLWNLPWEFKCDGEPKSLLRAAFADVLPKEILNRKKSAFPKTYHPQYDQLVREQLTGIVNDSASPILQLLDKSALTAFLEQPSCVVKPWFGQLMATPQLIAFYIQLNFWLQHYNVEIL